MAFVDVTFSASYFDTPVSNLLGANPSGTTPLGGTNVQWDYYWHGMRLDPATGLYFSQTGGQAYNPRLGRTMQPQATSGSNQYASPDHSSWLDYVPVVGTARQAYYAYQDTGSAWNLYALAAVSDLALNVFTLGTASILKAGVQVVGRTMLEDGVVAAAREGATAIGAEVAGNAAQLFARDAGGALARQSFATSVARGVAIGGGIGAAAGGYAGYQYGGWDGALEGAINGGLKGAAFGGVASGLLWFADPTCFVAGTQVVVDIKSDDSASGTTDNRGGNTAVIATSRYVTKSIEKLVAGDTVYGRGENVLFGPMEPFRIEEVFRRRAYHLRTLMLRSADGLLQTLKTTNEHPIYGPGTGWMPAGQLKVGDKLMQADGDYAVVEATRQDEYPTGIEVFNLRVADAHTYLVREDGFCGEPIWVHNAYQAEAAEAKPARAYRSLNQEDIESILAGDGISREGGRRGISAMADLIGYNKQDTRYIAVTEDPEVLQNTNDYIEFNTADTNYISQQDILNNKSLMAELAERGRYVEQQAHGLVSGQIPRSAMTRIVIGGKQL